MDWFDRVPMVYRPALETARSMLPQKVVETAPLRFLCGVSPLFVGLHGYDDTGDGRSYADTAHACYPYHTSDGYPRVVLPYDHAVVSRSLDWQTMIYVHEIGHIFDWATGFSVTPPETTWYSKVSRGEAFAEAFSMMVHPTYADQYGWSETIEAESFRPFREHLGL